MKPKIAKYAPAFLAGVILVIIAECFSPKVNIFGEDTSMEPMTGYISYLKVLGLDLSQETTASSGIHPVLNQDMVFYDINHVKGGDRWTQYPTNIDSKTFIVNHSYLGYAVNKIPNPDRTAIIYSAATNSSGYRAVMFANLQARAVSQAEWDSIKKQSHID